MRVGIFDSGIGGLTVLGEALKALPNTDFFYYADSYYAPYGIKEKSFVMDRIMTVADFLDHKNIDALLVACNTATSIGVKSLRQIYDYPIIGMEPAVKLGLDKHPDRRILVFATPLTLQEDKYHSLIEKYDEQHHVDQIAMPRLVEFAEKGIFNGFGVETYIQGALKDYNLEDYGTLVLGCTHFIYFKEIIRRLLPKHMDVIDGNLGTIRQLIRKTDARNSLEFSNRKRIIKCYKSTDKGYELVDFTPYISL